MASQGCSLSRAIPTRRVILSESVHLPHDYSSTPGGTLFSTTPGGTRIIYDRKFLMECRNSPVTKTPPRDLPNIPGVTSPSTEASKPETIHTNNHEEKPATGEDSQFEMDI
ncbi:eukaryotic translation initiation factor 4E-binding protein 1 [Ambystoma mexicanum]|uniref:eukaryotic translation initiation factor 4E-binding protein 1 n=1 Tax=Ambystoma mexicanum TaxID=8296 RepID=UPI0037E91102